VSALSIKDELTALESRKAELSALMTTALPAIALHPRMPEVFREKANMLSADLQHDGQRDAARQALRSFIERIMIPSDGGRLQVVGNFGEMLAAAAAKGRRGSRANSVV